MAGGEASEGLGRREEGISVGELTKSTVPCIQYRVRRLLSCLGGVVCACV